MTAPAYSTDLTLITNAESGTWGEITGYQQGGTPAVNDQDYFIQGAGCTTQSPTNKTGLNVSMYFDYGSDLSGSFSAGDVVLFWQVLLAGNAIDTFANGGLRLGIGSGAGDFKMYKSGGKDYGRNPYGGWQNIAIDPAYSGGADYTIGSPGSAYQYFASHPNLLNAISKGNLHAVDAIRYGRAQLLCEYGDLSNGYATIAGAAAKNDANDATAGYNRWGLMQQIAGGFLWKGLLSLGSGSNAVDFRDENRVIIIDDCPRTYADFNKIEVNNASSRVDWTNFNIQALGTLSKGRFEAVANADINFDTCIFTDMDTFIFQSNSELIDCTFRRCGQVTQGGATITGCLFEESPAAISLVASNPSAISGCHFISDGSNHAMRATATGDYNWNNTLSGYAASDGSTGNEAFYNDSGGHINLTVQSGDKPSVRNGSGATTTVIENPITLKFIVKDESQSPINGAYAYIDEDNTSPYILNTTTDVNGIAEITSYTDYPQSGTTWRVRKYGYKPFVQIVDIGSENITLPVTLIADPQQT